MVAAWTVLLFIVCTGIVSDNLPPPKVTIRTGKLRGTYMMTRDGKLIEAYLGIPYAIPPLGELRFESAQPAKPWKGIRTADTMPPACIQQKTTVGKTSEDCLYLNVFTPTSRVKAKLPVMVWIHGGSFQSNAISTFTPEYMLDDPIVLVTIQYRLGLFGWLSTGDQVVPGNQGLKDQRLALRWVQENIRKFGGDPKKVTLFGQSSGAMSVHALMLFSAKEGLFRAGICQSGVSLMTIAFHLPDEIYQTKQELASMSKCPTDSVGFVTCLKEKPAEFILNLLTEYKESTIVGKLFQGSLPLIGITLEPDCVPDRIVTANPWELSVDIPFLAGVMDSESLEYVAPLGADKSGSLLSGISVSYDILITEALNYQYSSADGSGVPEATKDFYFENKPISRDTFPQFVETLTDAFFTYPIYEGVRKSTRTDTYFYYFEYIGANHNYAPLPPNETVGAAHEDDVYFFFPHPNSLVDNRIYSKRDDMLSRRLVKLWTNFATYLNPTPSSEEIEWKPFGEEEYFYIIGQDSISLNRTFLRKRMDFWNNQPYVNRDDTIGSFGCVIEEVSVTHR